MVLPGTRSVLSHSVYARLPPASIQQLAQLTMSAHLPTPPCHCPYPPTLALPRLFTPQVGFSSFSLALAALYLPLLSSGERREHAPAIQIYVLTREVAHAFSWLSCFPTPHSCIKRQSSLNLSSPSLSEAAEQFYLSMYRRCLYVSSSLPVCTTTAGVPQRLANPFTRKEQSYNVCGL